MDGYVFGLHALLNLPFRIAGKPDIEIEFVIDTGFAGFLTLPPAAVNALHLPYVRRLIANLADGSTIQTDVYSATIVWDGVEIDVEVLATGRQPLLGTLMLKRRNLDVDFIDGGKVRVCSLLWHSFGTVAVRRDELLRWTKRVVAAQAQRLPQALSARQSFFPA